MTALAQQIAEPKGWTEKQREDGRRKGAESTRTTAAQNRALWRDHVVRMLADGYLYSRTWPTRTSLLSGLEAYNFDHRIKGKGGGKIKKSTIAKWLGEELLIALQVEAIDGLIAIERAKHQR